MSGSPTPVGRGESFRRGSEFVKEYIEDIEIEFEKANKVFEISNECGGFLGTKPLAIDPEQSQITYEYMNRPVESVREVFIEALTDGPRAALAVSVFANIGRSLCTIHKNLDLTSWVPWEIPGKVTLNREYRSILGAIERRGVDEAVFLHGDFGFSNIFHFTDNSVSNDVPDLWIIDPSPNFFMTHKPNAKGPPELDIANLAACMHGLVPPGRQMTCHWSRSGDLIEALICGYQGESKQMVDRRLLKSLVNLTLAQYLQQRVPNALLRTMTNRLLNHRVNKSSVYREKL